MRKLLGVIHAILRDDRDYAGEYLTPKRRKPRHRIFDHRRTVTM